MQFGAPDDGRKTRLKHVERLTEINCETSHLVGCTLRMLKLSFRYVSALSCNDLIRMARVIFRRFLIRP